MGEGRGRDERRKGGEEGGRERWGRAGGGDGRREEGGRERWEKEGREGGREGEMGEGREGGRREGILAMTKQMSKSNQ